MTALHARTVSRRGHCPFFDLVRRDGGDGVLLFRHDLDLFPLSIDFGRRAALTVYISCVLTEVLFTLRIISEGVLENGARYYGRNNGHVLILP